VVIYKEGQKEKRQTVIYNNKKTTQTTKD